MKRRIKPAGPLGTAARRDVVADGHYYKPAVLDVEAADGRYLKIDQFIPPNPPPPTYGFVGVQSLFGGCVFSLGLPASTLVDCDFEGEQFFQVQDGSGAFVQPNNPGATYPDTELVVMRTGLYHVTLNARRFNGTDPSAIFAGLKRNGARKVYLQGIADGPLFSPALPGINDTACGPALSHWTYLTAGDVLAVDAALSVSPSPTSANLEMELAFALQEAGATP